ncbi:MAG: PQQ-binding-like beta-propeller repeat protein [Nitrospirae bacterium]|nr:PQQ-binding-like beta-propeller repeat protein [Nitrospirota bacterium]
MRYSILRCFGFRAKVIYFILVVLVGAAPGIAVAEAADWPAYLFGPAHSSWNSLATAITPANAAGLVQAWQWTPDAPILPGQPEGALLASPTVFLGRIYIGTNSGDFYALDEATGGVVWKRFIAFAPGTTCGAIGFSSTATVAADPVTDRPTVYVGAADGYLYALDAADGSTVWRSLVAAPSETVNDYYIWGSPTVFDGRIYIGVSSQCDNPLVQGGLRAFDQSTGALLASYDTVPNSSLGGSIWSSAAAQAGAVWVTTGNEDPGSPQVGDSNSIIRLDSLTLVKQDIWTVPLLQQTHDGDFGASPTLFSVQIGRTLTGLIGACNKNGKFYALNAMNLYRGPVWSFQVSRTASGRGFCLAAAVWDGSRLFVAGNETTIRRVAYKGSVRRLSPATGKPIWETGLPAQVIGTPTLNASGVLAAATWNFSANAAYLLNAATGAILATISTSNSMVFAQPVFADNYLLIATQDQGLHAYQPGP